MNYTKTEWKDLPDTSTPITSSRLNNMEDGIEYLFEHGVGGGDNLPVGVEMDFDGTAQDIPTGWTQITNPESYSATEVKTDRVWIDNKPIYRKVLNIGTADFYSSTDKHFTHDIDDLDTMLNVTYSMYFPGDNCYYKQWDKIITVKSNSTRVSFTTSSISGTYIRFTNVKIVLEYTKVSDQGGNS